MIEKTAIENVLRRVDNILHIVGAVPEKDRYRVITENPDGLPELSEREISIYRHIVRTGIVKDLRHCPPTGYKVLGLLIQVRELQARNYLISVEKQRLETVDIMTGTWLKSIENASGDIEQAKERMKTLWGSSKMDSNTRSIFNQAFLIAKQQWETSIKNETA